jgi:hypothetical protein
MLPGGEKWTPEHPGFRDSATEKDRRKHLSGGAAAGFPGYSGQESCPRSATIAFVLPFKSTSIDTGFFGSERPRLADDQDNETRTDQPRPNERGS